MRKPQVCLTSGTLCCLPYFLFLFQTGSTHTLSFHRSLSRRCDLALWLPSGTCLGFTRKSSSSFSLIPLHVRTFLCGVKACQVTQTMFGTRRNQMSHFLQFLDRYGVHPSIHSSVHTHTHTLSTSTGLGGRIPKDQFQNLSPSSQRGNLVSRHSVHHPRPKPQTLIFLGEWLSVKSLLIFLCAGIFKKIFSTKLPTKGFHLKHLWFSCNSC